VRLLGGAGKGGRGEARRRGGERGEAGGLGRPGGGGGDGIRASGDYFWTTPEAPTAAAAELGPRQKNI
jgi:hypothetical protein